MAAEQPHRRLQPALRYRRQDRAASSCLQQHLLITMPAASPFRRLGQPKTCLFGFNMVRYRAQRRGQRTLGRFHDFSRSLSGWGAPNYGTSTEASRAGIFAHGHYAVQ